MSNSYVIQRNEFGKMTQFIPVTDYQRKKVYAAERKWIADMWDNVESAKGSPSGCACPPDADPDSIFYKFSNIDAVKAYLDSLSSSEWMINEYGEGIAIKLLDTEVRLRRGNKISAARFSKISLAPKWGLRKDVVLHEFAHVIVHQLHGVDGGHGRLFAKTYLTLIKYAIDSDTSESLRYIFDKMGVQYTGDDSFFASEKIKKQKRAEENGLIVVTHHYSYQTNTDEFKIGRLPIQKIRTSAVPKMEWNGYSRWAEWNDESYMVNGQKTKINWEMRWGKYAYFSLTDDDGLIQWYKFRMESSGFCFIVGSDNNYYLFTPPFAKKHSDDNLIAITKKLATAN